MNTTLTTTNFHVILGQNQVFPWLSKVFSFSLTFPWPQFFSLIFLDYTWLWELCTQECNFDMVSRYGLRSYRGYAVKQSWLWDTIQWSQPGCVSFSADIEILNVSQVLSSDFHDQRASPIPIMSDGPLEYEGLILRGDCKFTTLCPIIFHGLPDFLSKLLTLLIESMDFWLTNF